jgi:hypothetical protein
VREESNLNAEGRPYSTLLPDCRAYEMVSPLEKQGRDAGEGETGNQILPIAVSPDGEAAGWSSEGVFAGLENFAITASPENWYRSRRGGSGWTTSGAFGPRKLVNEPWFSPFDSDFSPDLHSYHATCGTNTATPGQGGLERASLACARSVDEGEWKASPSYKAINGSQIEGSQDYLGASSDLSRLFVQPAAGVGSGPGPFQGELGNAMPLALSGAASRGIYELAGIGSSSPTLRLVNVDNPPPGAPPGTFGEELGIKGEGPMLGDQRANTLEWGGASHAISEDGRTVFFTATPPGSQVLTIYARRQCAPAPTSPNCNEDGNGEFFETVPLSDGSQCSECSVSERKSANFMGASADGSKVFFMTAQKLLSKEPFPTRNLYEYNFEGPPGKKLVLLSAEAGNVSGLMAVSADGSHVYFVNVLAGKSNLYGYDTVTGHEPKLVATATGTSPNPWGFEATQTNNCSPCLTGPYQREGGARPAQVTPDGRDLVFTSSLSLTSPGPEPGVAAVYRYDFPTEKLTWVSHAPGFVTPAGGEKSAQINTQPGRHLGIVGPNADIEDWGRAISGCPHPASAKEGERCPEGSYDGEYIIFTTATQLQANDLNGERNLYEWHCPGNVDCAKNGEVSLISDGLDPKGVQLAPGPTVPWDVAPTTAMSATGSDIFFSTHTRLVGQDTDSLRDVYDARVGGGFPAPSEPACSGEACQGALGKTTSFEPPASANFAPGGNSKAVEERHTGNSKGRPTLTPAQQLAAALKACRAKRRSKRASCESQARKRYAAQLRAQALLACKRKPKSERGRCEAKARKRH